MASTGLTRKDTTKGPPLRVLSLDGGGVRGYSMFIIIQEIMHRTFVEMEGRAPRRHEIPKPADHFDLIVGTGTGGLIALMLGRLRLDLETCKELYVRMTRMVFETDKTLFGIPTHSTLFKASKLEEAIQEAVREHTVSGSEGDDGTSSLFSPLSPQSRGGNTHGPRRHLSNASVVSFSAKSPTAQMARPAFTGRGGDPNARLYDERENRTKTAVTAIYNGARSKSDVVLLRSYDSRRETAPEYDCTIWEAGRATCSIGLAFKPIRIGQTVFHDGGDGKFNPSPEALEEAMTNEWPGREIGVFLSLGTGKRPKSSDVNKTEWYEGFLGGFAEARRRLISKIEGCEKTHELMKKDILPSKGVNIDNYYRLNVEVGVGEFGMNEWNRLSEISTSTRMYLGRRTEQKMVQDCAARLAKINRAKQRLDRYSGESELKPFKEDYNLLSPLAVELPAEIPEAWPPAPNTPSNRSIDRQSYDSGIDALSVPTNQRSPRSSYERVLPPIPQDEEAAIPPPLSPRRETPPEGRVRPPSAPVPNHSADHDDHLVVHAPSPAQFRTAAGTDKIAIVSADERPRGQGAYGSTSPQRSRVEPPPLPPKTPLPDHQAMRRVGTAPAISSIDAAVGGGGGAAAAAPPYPLDDEQPPPPVGRKPPNYQGR
ncbi:FabD/lysophospholipase-like protein [Cryphonectria parasitica EP155]|uniref:FabD/lysophospholipase-like protein n=1 Tax=Cryphonectria parasitica (strain ATCC 38755 / EP155) TaxID=660469 RepID=A0A9P4XUE3_CRYP1|nr:FabD/lysophospholipase-like protein [Cryphonectria parasitica EP155]KAF3760977.1 FabD/lysophospholipase-like protein [Cryphonectria parasitica EP155]